MISLLLSHSTSAIAQPGKAARQTVSWQDNSTSCTCSWTPPSTLEVPSRPWLSVIIPLTGRPVLDSTRPEDSLSSELASSDTLDSALDLSGLPCSGRVRPCRFSSGRPVSLSPGTDLNRCKIYGSAVRHEQP